METAEPVSYEFPAFAHRRLLESSLYPYYAHPTTAPYSLPYQAPSAVPYPWASLNHPSSSHAYHYFVGQPALGAPVRLTSEQFPQTLPEIRPARNAIGHVVKPELGPNVQGSGNRAVSLGSLEEKLASETEFSTEVDVLMKAIQARARPSSSSSSSPVQRALPPLQQLTPPGYPGYAMSPPRCQTNEGQLSRSGKKRKYTCTLPDCNKSFAQKTHLDIHTRAHTGDKPFVSGPEGTAPVIATDNVGSDLQGTLVRPAILTARQSEGERHSKRVPRLSSIHRGPYKTHTSRRPISAVTQVKSHSLATFATNASLSEGMFEPTRSPIIKPSHSHVCWMSVTRSLPS